MDYTLRPATVDDGIPLGVQHVAAWHEAYPHLLSAASFRLATPEARGQRWVDILTASAQGTWVAVAEDGEIIGHAGAGASAEDPDRLELYSIYVLAKAYGTGVGQALLDAVIGDKPAGLWVAAENPRAQAFYRRNGFEVVGEPVTRTFLRDEIVELRMLRDSPEGRHIDAPVAREGRYDAPRGKS